MNGIAGKMRSIRSLPRRAVYTDAVSESVALGWDRAQGLNPLRQAQTGEQLIPPRKQLNGLEVT